MLHETFPVCKHRQAVIIPSDDIGRTWTIPWCSNRFWRRQRKWWI